MRHDGAGLVVVRRKKWCEWDTERKEENALNSKNYKTRLFQGDIESRAAKKSIEEAFSKETLLLDSNQAKAFLLLNTQNCVRLSKQKRAAAL